MQAGRRPSLHFRGLLGLHSRCGLPDCSTAQRRPLSRGFDPVGYPAVPLVSYQSLPTILWVVPSSTGEPRRWGALNKTGEGVALDIVLGIIGAVVGGFLFTQLGATGVTGFNLYSMFVAVIGAIVVLVLYHAVIGRRSV
jgi:uncharacterized membrane protein YeaQ/YmgE (transglycosylase-associated protein family)